jgi:drug/metabolite transporter (DMT)-like permease
VAQTPERRLADSVEGTSQADFGGLDWGQLLLAAGIFGSAFLWISLALRSISPETIAFGRVAMGAVALGAVPAARCRIARPDWPRLLVASVVGIAAPALLFGVAEQRISSALAGMLVSGVPVMTAVVAAIETRRFPRSRRLIGLVVGMIGIGLLAGPDLTAEGAEALGVGLVLVAVVCYAVATTLYAPLQQTYGSLRVTWWVLNVSSIVLLPLGVVGFARSTVELLPVLALVVLGVFGTGVVWALFMGLIGRVGAVRASIVGYLIPIVALILGVAVLGESVGWVQIAGVIVALGGGYLLSRATRREDRAVPEGAAEETVAHHVPLALHMCR